MKRHSTGGALPTASRDARTTSPALFRSSIWRPDSARSRSSSGSRCTGPPTMSGSGGGSRGTCKSWECRSLEGRVAIQQYRWRGYMDSKRSDNTELAPFEVRRIHIALLVCFFLSGATGLVYEVVWTRMAGLVFGNTVYAVTTVLAAFFGGLALGSYLLGLVADRARRHVHLYGLMEIGMGLYCLCNPLLFRGGEKIYLSAYQTGRETLLLC